MVYTKVNLVHGIELNKTQLKDFIKWVDVFRNNTTKTTISFSMDEKNFYDDVVNRFISKNNIGDLKLFRYGCCSDIMDKKFILGKIVHEYKRVAVKCDKCNTNSVCDTCM